ncbi:MAG: alpha/beta hydrolase family protein [Streptosporangiaceae bacterium]
MQPAAGKLFLTQLIPAPLTGPHQPPSPPPSVPLDGVRLPVTRARQGAPVDLSARRCPVVLYSPGYEDDRELGTGLVSDLASRGYVVVTIDHTYEAAEVEFPGGRVEVSRQPKTQAAIYEAATVRVPDTRFVLNELAALNSGINPDAEHHPLPAGLAGALDLARTGMFGHSLGGATAANAMAADPRIIAGINLDGTIFPAAAPASLSPLSQQLTNLAGAVAKRVGDRPFMMMASGGHRLDDDNTWAGFWRNLSGWRLLLSLRGSQHYSYTDDEEFLSQLITAGIISASIGRQVVVPTIGRIDPDRAVAAERAYIGAFFDLHLRHHGGGLLARPSLSYPQVQFLAS